MSDNVLQEAEKIIHGQRQVDYGGKKRSFDKIATLWSEVLDYPVTGEQVALCLIQFKIARAVANLEAHGEVLRDSIVDIAGYAGCLEIIQTGDGEL